MVWLRLEIDLLLLEWGQLLNYRRHLFLSETKMRWSNSIWSSTSPTHFHMGHAWGLSSLFSNLLSLSFWELYSLLLLCQFPNELHLFLFKGLSSHLFEHSDASIATRSDLSHLLTLSCWGIFVSHQIIVRHERWNIGLLLRLRCHVIVGSRFSGSLAFSLRSKSLLSSGTIWANILRLFSRFDWWLLLLIWSFLLRLCIQLKIFLRCPASHDDLEIIFIGQVLKYPTSEIGWNYLPASVLLLVGGQR